MGESKKTYDVVIIGAGLSGIGAGYHLKNKCPLLSFAILEGRAAIGGTWDLFKYPGIRSDSDMYTFGFPFNPWKDPQAIADGPAILQYINETADQFKIREHIQFNKRVLSSAWSSEDKKWTLEVVSNETNETEIIECNFIFACCGYYNYEHGYEPEFPHFEAFKGLKIHPQKWDSSLDYTDKNIVIIGSGATAVTLLPELAKKARHVTMLQRSPTYIANMPREDRIANFLKRNFPAKFAHSVARWKNILFGIGFYWVSRNYPNAIRNFLKKHIKEVLGEKYEDRHFDPKYNPWDQRLCLVPDDDLFEAIKIGKASIVTDTIETFTENGIELNSGDTLPADIIVTATGLSVQLFGGMKIKVDENTIETGKIHAYKGVMFSEIPNFAVAIGYTNASWTLKCDLNCQFVTRVLNYMKENNYSVCVPQFDYENQKSEPLLDFNSGYVLRANDILPKQGSKPPWKVYQNYVKDVFSLKYGDAKDKYLVYK
jgi:cation diffusion facilitator CzcD-associated flavoprotein CzcO